MSDGFTGGSGVRRQLSVLAARRGPIQELEVRSREETKRGGEGDERGIEEREEIMNQS